MALLYTTGKKEIKSFWRTELLSKKIMRYVWELKIGLLS